MRALGVGIIVTTLLMGYSQKGQAQMTDEEILQRAAELGRTEQQGVLAELATATPKPVESLQSAADSAASPTAAPAASPTMAPMTESTTAPTTDPTTAPAASPTAAPTAEPTASPTTAPTAEPTASPTTAPTADPTASPMTAPTADPTAAPIAQPTVDPATAGGVVTLVINRGESSVTVSKNLQALGLVEDYRTYDQFLCDNGYDHSICTGTYEISVNATEEDIARIITKKQ